MKLLALFGEEFEAKHMFSHVKKLIHDGYTILALDGRAMLLSSQNKFPYICIDHYMDSEMIYQCTAAADNFSRLWYQDESVSFSSDGICWPELDRDAMTFFWRETIVAAVFMELFFKGGGKDLLYFGSNDRIPSLFYYKSDTWKRIIDIYLGIFHNKLRYGLETEKPNILRKVKEIAGDIHSLDSRVAEKEEKDNLRMGSQCDNKTFQDVHSHGNKVIFALNPGELHRFSETIKHTSKNYNGQTKLYILNPDNKLAIEWQRKLGIPVLAGPNVKNTDPILQKQFYNAYLRIRQTSNNNAWEIFLSIAYHFEYYCKMRWPMLSELLKGWYKIWKYEKPTAVVVSSLLDTESQLPAVAANDLKSITFSIPHARSQRGKNTLVSNYILNDYLPFKLFLEKIGIPSRRLLDCKDALGDYSYPTQIKVSHNRNENEKRLNVLVLQTSLFNDTNLIIPISLPSKQIIAIQSIAKIPANLKKSIHIKFKIHPLSQDFEQLEMAGLDRDEYLLPHDSDLLDVLDMFDVVVDLNNTNASTIAHCTRKKKPLLFFWSGHINDYDQNAEILLEAGELVTSGHEFWKAISRFQDDRQYRKSLTEKSSQFYTKYSDSTKYPSLVEIIEEKTSKTHKPFGHSAATKKLPQIVNIDADPEYYYGEIPQQHFNQVLENGKKINNIESAIGEYCKQTNNQYFKEYALDPRRAIGLKLLDNCQGRRVLDYGCGLGSLGILAAKSGAHVTFVDSCLPRLQAAHARAEQHNLNNTQFIACKSWNSFPPDIGAFDAILLNGILEWIPTASGCKFDNVLDTQIDFLFKMQQILSSNGKILLAIENRFALQYFMGHPEDHTDIQYLSIMSRNKANELHLKEKGTEFLAWTWSLNDYNELLPKAHLKLADAYAIFPDYRFPRLIVSLDDKQGVRDGMLIEKYNAPKELKERFIDYLYEMGMIEHFVYSYSLLLEKGDTET